MKVENIFGWYHISFPCKTRSASCSEERYPADGQCRDQHVAIANNYNNYMWAVVWSSLNLPIYWRVKVLIFRLRLLSTLSVTVVYTVS